MSWVTVIWSMLPSAAITLAVVHVLVWFRRPKALAHAFFALSAVAVALLAICELWMMKSDTPGEFSTALRWLHVPAWMAIAGLMGFVYFQLHAGRLWLAWTVVGVRTVSLVLNFVLKPNLNYREITALRHVNILGEPVSIPDGVSSPWMLIGQLSLLMFVIFVVDATLVVWRRGERRRALLLGGAASFFTVAASAQAVLALWAIVPTPITASLFYLGIVLVMAFELTDHVLRAGRLAEDLSESEARLSLAMDAAKAGVWSWDFDTSQIWATPKTYELFGFSPDEKVTFDQFVGAIHPDDRERIRSAALQAVHEGVEFQAECRIVFPDESVHWIKSQARAFLKPSGAPNHMMGVSMDIGAHKQSEGEMARLRLELAHLSRIMTMNQLSTSLAHEINQPLGAILNNASAGTLMLRKPEYGNDDVAEILADIVQDAKRAGDVIRKIRGMIKKTDAQFELLKMNSLIEDIVGLFHTSIIMGKVSLRLDLAPGLADVRGDRVRLQQVLVNLITNATDAMRNASSKVLTIRSRMEDLDTITVSVCDTGTGVVSAMSDRLFEPFFTTKKDGLGMGLPICRAIIEEHGGRIWSLNNPDSGATFSFSMRTIQGHTHERP